MNNMFNLEKIQAITGSKSTGSAAMLTVVMLLVMMTLLIFYNARVTALEQRISGNDRRAKLAHHTAEAGNAHAMRFFNEYIKDVVSSDVTEEGWLATGFERWTLCAATDTTPPCSHAPLESVVREDSFVRENVYYYNFGGSSDLPTPIIDEFTVGVDSTNYTVQALLCIVDFDEEAYIPGDETTYAKCDPTLPPVSDLFAIKLIANGVADDGSSEAIVEKIIGNVQSGGGSPGVPLSVTSSSAATGTVSIVTAPNAGGPNVPISIWSKNDVDFVGGASSSTCEFEDYLQDRDSSFWRTITLSGGETVTVCDSCRCPDTIEKGALSYTNTGEGAREYIDIVDNDPNFPDDLFAFYFGVPRTACRVEQCAGFF
jgi:hypothetical protein